MNNPLFSRFISGIVVSVYYLALSQIQTQWAFYLSASWMFAILLTYASSNIPVASWKSRIGEFAITFCVLGAGMFARFSLQSFDNINSIDDLLKDHTLMLAAGLAIPFCLSKITIYLTQLFAPVIVSPEHTRIS